MRTVLCNLPKTQANHDDVPAGCAMSEMGSCTACRKVARVRGIVTKKVPIPATIGRFDMFDIPMSIPSSENEDCHEDRGPNQLDPCDCCRRQVQQAATRDHTYLAASGWFMYCRLSAPRNAPYCKTPLARSLAQALAACSARGCTSSA